MTKKLLWHIYGGGSEKKYTKAKWSGKPGFGFIRYRNRKIFTTHPGLMYTQDASTVLIKRIRLLLYQGGEEGVLRYNNALVDKAYMDDKANMMGYIECVVPILCESS